MKRLLTLLVALFALNTSSAQFISGRVNALSALTATVDVGVDVAVTDNATIDVGVRYNPLKSLRHTSLELGTRYWLYENFVGHFVGAQGRYTTYNIERDAHSYKGQAYTFGLSYGYSWILSVRWSVAIEGGIGLCHSFDTRRELTPDDWASEYVYHTQRLSLIPNRFGLTFNYLF